MRIVLEQMIARRNGLMLTMSSGSAISPLGQLPVYGSTKRFVLHLSHSLQAQFPEHLSGVRFHAFHPHFILTNMTEKLIRTTNRLLFPTARTWVNSAMRTIRSTSGASAGYIGHECLVWMQRHAAWIIEQSWSFVSGFDQLQKNKFA